MTVTGPDGITRSYDEHYDAQMDVEQDPCGAFMAIQEQAARIAKLETALRNIDDLNRTQPDEDGHTWAVSDLINQEITFAQISNGGMTPGILEDMRIAVASEGTTRVKRAWERIEAVLAETDEAPTGAVFVDGQWVKIE